MAEATQEQTSEEKQCEEVEMRERVLRLAFGGDTQRFAEFCDILRAALPPETAAVLRGSCVTGERWNDGAPFDADGPGTSDMDLTLVGDEIHELYTLTGYFIPGIHSRPLSDDDLDVAPDLIPLRERLMSLVNRPVNIQATRDWVMYVRENLMGQPYLTLIEKNEKA